MWVSLCGCGGDLTTTAEQRAIAGGWPAERALSQPVPLVNVEASGFLGRRIQANTRSVLKGLESPIPERFEARVAGTEPGLLTNRLASDSDLYKWIEGASYMLALTGDPRIERELERITRLVLACQQDDGYINTQVPPNTRFDPKVNHDLYMAGHFFEAAVAHHRATGKRDLLEAAQHWADYLIAEYEAGNPYYRTVPKKEHSEYELGLLRLYRATGEEKYLDFSAALARMIPIDTDLLQGGCCGNGHAVRINYLLTSYADLYLETGQPEFLRNIAAIWDEIATTRSYVTGGVSAHERYPKQPFYLPQVTDHPRRDAAETCTSISFMMLSWRLHGLEAQSRYFDQIERILYNHYLGAMSLDHLSTFYYNPLRMLGGPAGKTDHDGPLTRRTALPEIHTTACCITNEWRFFGALSEYLYSYDDRGIFVNLYTTGAVRQQLVDGRNVAFSVETNYPHDGNIAITINGDAPMEFALRLRIPDWCGGADLSIGDEQTRSVNGGDYVTLERTWQPGERIELKLPMPVRMVVPNPQDTLNQGQGVLVRGPLVYCLDQVDADFPVEQARWAFSTEESASAAAVEWRPELLEGVNLLRAPGKLTDGSARTLTLIPFYARANRSDDNHWVTYLPLRAER
jgi:uncharacterized protein